MNGNICSAAVRRSWDLAQYYQNSKVSTPTLWVLISLSNRLFVSFHYIGEKTSNLSSKLQGSRKFLDAKNLGTIRKCREARHWLLGLWIHLASASPGWQEGNCFTAAFSKRILNRRGFDWFLVLLSDLKIKLSMSLRIHETMNIF